MEHSYEDIIALIDNIVNNDLRKLVGDYLTKYRDDFERCPGSIGHHHVYTGGLLDHTVEVCNIALMLHYSELIISNELQNEDYTKQGDDLNYICLGDKIISSGTLHDVGKINQYAMRDYPVREENGIDTVYKWTYKMSKEESKNYDHAVWVVNDFRTVTKKNLHDDIRNAILAHHGGWTTNGAKCDTLLDAIIHAADLISSRAGK